MSASDLVTFAGGELDRAAHRRGDSAWLPAPRAGPAARALLAGPEGIVLEGDAPLLARMDEGDGVFLGVAGDPPLFGAAAPAGAELTNVRDAAAQLSGADAGLVAYAVALANWH